MIVGYARVSSPDQNLERQLVMLREHGCEQIYSESLSGIDAERPEFKKMLAWVRAGDTLIVESFSRLARSTRDLLNVVNALTEKQVHFKSLKEEIDTSTPQGTFMLTVFAGMYQFEREQIKQRQAEGIALARAHDAQLKAEGRKPEKYRGRPMNEIPRDFAIEYERWKRGLQSAAETYKKLDLTKSSFYRMVRAYEAGRIHGLDNVQKDDISAALHLTDYEMARRQLIDLALKLKDIERETAERADVVEKNLAVRKQNEKFIEMAFEERGCQPVIIKKPVDRVAQAVDLLTQQHDEMETMLTSIATKLEPVNRAIKSIEFVSQHADELKASATESDAETAHDDAHGNGSDAE